MTQTNVLPFHTDSAVSASSDGELIQKIDSLSLFFTAAFREFIGLKDDRLIVYPNQTNRRILLTISSFLADQYQPGETSHILVMPNNSVKERLYQLPEWKQSASSLELTQLTRCIKCATGLQIKWN